MWYNGSEPWEVNVMHSTYLTPANNIRIHSEQVHNFSFALVAPLSPEHNGHFVLRLLRDAERRVLLDALPRPLHDRLSVLADGLLAVNVRHGAVGFHAAALLLLTGISFYRVSLRHRKWTSAALRSSSSSSVQRNYWINLFIHVFVLSSRLNQQIT